jgi:predicted ATP-dependent protease
VQADKFHIWSVGSIEEGIEVLTGVPAGRQEDGSFAAEGLFARVDQRLARMAEELAKFGDGK